MALRLSVLCGERLLDSEEARHLSLELAVEGGMRRYLS